MWIGGIGFIATLPFALLDLDTHHDGVMIAPAVAVADGIPLFSDAFSQYGPVTHWLHGFFLALWPFGEAAGLRVLNTILIAVTAALIIETGRIAPAEWGLNPRVTTLVGTAWLFLNDVFYGVPMLPWSSVVVSLLLVTLAWQAARVLSVHRSNSVRVQLILLGLLVSLLPATRQTVGFLMIGMAIIALGLASLQSRLARRWAIWTTVGFSLGLSFILTPIWLSGAFEDWIDQTILWPISWAASATERGSPLVGASANLTVLVLVLCFLFLLVAISRKSISVAVSIASVFLASSLAIFPVLDKDLFVASQFSEATGTAWTRWFLETSSSSLFFFFGFNLFALLVSLGVIARWSKPRSRRSLMGPIILVLISISSLSQVFPVGDSRHVWWALAPMTLLLAWHISQLPSFFRCARLWLPATSIAAMATIMTAGANLLLVDRVEYPTDSITSGMWGRPNDVAKVSETEQLLKSDLVPAKAYFLVSDGLLSVMNGSYSSIDQFFVDWGPLPEMENRFQRPATVVADEHWKEDLLAISGKVITQTRNGSLIVVQLK